jgi:hypothetical protein
MAQTSEVLSGPQMRGQSSSIVARAPKIFEENAVAPPLK